MLKRIAFNAILFFILSPTAFSQGWTLSSVIKASEIEPKFSVIDGSGNSYILASFKDTIYNPLIISKGNADLALIKLNNAGSLVWYKQIGGTGLDNAGSLDINGNELFVLINFQNTVKFSSTDSLVSKGSFDVGLCKFSVETGNYISCKTIGTSNGATDAQVILNAKIYSSKLIAVGNFNNTIYLGANPNSDTLLSNSFSTNFIAQMDLQGNLEWSKTIYGTSSNYKVNKIGVSENGYYFGGFFRGSVTFDVGTITSYTTGYNDNFVYKTSFTGTGEWIRKIFGSQTENIQAVTTDGFDNVYVLGNYGSPTLFVDSTQTDVKSHPVNLGNFDTYICKYNRSGILQWLILKGSPGRDIYNDFILGNNVIYATGYFTNQIIFNNDTINSSGLANSDAFVAAFNQTGDPISGASIVGTGDFEDAGATINMDANSRAYVSGYYKSKQIEIGDQTYTSNSSVKPDLFFAIYRQPFKAVITEQKNISCHGLNDGLLRTTPYFGRAPFTYSWSHDPGNHLSVATNLSPGTYTVTITDANDSTAYISATITQPDTLAVSGIITPATCYNDADGAINISATGGTKTSAYSYFWTTLDGSGITPLSEDQSGLTGGTYTVSIQDDNNCAISKDFIVTEPGSFNYAGTTVTDITLPGSNGAVNLALTGGNQPYGYTWTGPGSFSTGTEDISGLFLGGLYNISVIDNKGCTSDTGFVVNDGITLIAQITEKEDVLCYGINDGSATITVFNGIGPYTYLWSDGSAVGPMRTGMSPDDYSVLVTDQTTSKTASATITINGPSSALNAVLYPRDPDCHLDYSGVVDLDVSGGTTPYRFDWNTGYTGEDLVGILGGTYSVTITDANDCSMQPDAVSLDEPDAIIVEITQSGQVLCFGDNTVNLTADITSGTGPFEYLWDDPGAQVTSTAYELSRGNYSVTVTNLNGCTATNSKYVDGPDEALSVQAVLNSPSCPGLSDGSILPAPSGGTAPYQNFIWSNEVFTQLNTSIPAGTYILDFDDANYCHLTDTFTLANPDTVKIASADLSDLTCSGQPDGSISISATGGTGIYEYSIDIGQSYSADPLFTALAQGEYVLTVKDDNDCLSSDITVSLSKSETCALIIYDAFSPDGNGKNDVWNIGNIDLYPACKVMVFNLWGIKVFSSDGYLTPWDGTYNSSMLPSGTYYYTIDPGDGSSTLTGAVSIVK
jgi:gliding motility-associated-like protein